MTYPTQRYLAQRPDGYTRDGIPGDCYAKPLTEADAQVLVEFHTQLRGRNSR